MMEYGNCMPGQLAAEASLLTNVVAGELGAPGRP